MIGVAGDAGLTDQLVMKYNLPDVPEGIFADLCDCMTFDTTVIRDATERGMTGHTIVIEVLVSLAQLARADHQVGIPADEKDDHACDADTCYPFHLLYIMTVMMCRRESRPKR